MHPETPLDDLIARLNEPQRDAVLHVGGPLLVLAGAGSGKTRVITVKIAHLVLSHGLSPWQILAVTFTNKAAAEMRERTAHVLGTDAKDVWLGTFHSIGLRILRRHAALVGRSERWVVHDDDDQERLMGQVLKELGVSTDVLPVRAARAYVDAQQHKLRGPDHRDLPQATHLERLCARAYEGYEKAKRAADAFDFGDLITKTVKLFEQEPMVLSEFQYRFRYVLVDEFQDTDVAQYKLLRLIAGDKSNLCVVGDDDQSIYRWRGAHVQNILGFPNDFGDREVKVVRLEQNYRSTGTILKAASGLIEKNSKRHGKTLWTTQGDGERLACYQAATEVGEARWVIGEALKAHRAGTPLREIAVLYRTHAQSRVLEDALRQNRLAYVVVGGLKFYERKEVKDVLAYLRAAANPRDELALVRILNVPPRGIGATTVDKVRQLARDEELPFWDALRRFAQSSDGIRARKSIDAFVVLLEGLRALEAQGQDVVAIAKAIVERTKLFEHLTADGPEGIQRKENVDELLVSIQAWAKAPPDGDATLGAFLDHVSLLTSLDQAEEKADALTLMTVHAAKGLEFDVVFVAGLEETVFPHFNAQVAEDVEEERRLCYVAITRGRKRVALSFAQSRQRFGRLDMNAPSRFLKDVPPEVLVHSSELGVSRPGSLFAQTTSFASGGARGGWAGPLAAKPVVKQRDSQELDYGFSQASASHHAGDGESAIGRRVKHPTFGTGKVARVDGAGPKARVTVQFPGFGSKTIVAEFLKFEEV